MDCKAHRKNSHLEIKALYLHQHHFDQDAVMSAFAQAVAAFRQFQNCDSVSLTSASPEHLTRELRRALEAAG